jgi:nucleoredoxin
MSWIESNLGTILKSKSGDISTKEAFIEKKVLGIYFSAHWCPPCRGFTPVLANFYNKIKSDGNAAFEIVFVSHDSDETSFTEYWADMPWLALPFDAPEKVSESLVFIL